MINKENGHQSSKISFKPSALSVVANQVWKTTASSDGSGPKSESLANLVEPPKFQSEKDTTEIASNGDDRNGKTFVFGSNICSRVTGSNADSGDASTSTAVSAFSDAPKLVANDCDTPKSNDGGLSLHESAAVHEAKCRPSVTAEPVDCLTGEEGETKVLSISCKLHWFDREKQSWVERGRGVLHLNDHSRFEDVQSKHCRIVMRCQGSLRVVINTKVWPEMHIERVRPKSLKISALDSDSSGSAFSLYLINAPPGDIDALESALSVRRAKSSPIKSKVSAPACETLCGPAGADPGCQGESNSSTASSLSEATTVSTPGCAHALLGTKRKPGLEDSDLPDEGSVDSVDIKKAKCDEPSLSAESCDTADDL